MRFGLRLANTFASCGGQLCEESVVHGKLSDFIYLSNFDFILFLDF